MTRFEAGDYAVLMADRAIRIVADKVAAFCIFFGKTPASRGEEIRAPSGVNVIGRVDGDATVFKRVRSGTTIKLERSEGKGAVR